MATSSRMTWVVASTGRSTSVGPSCSSAQSSSSPVAVQLPTVESSIRASTTCAWVIVSELAPLPTWIAAFMPDAAGTDTPEAPLVVTDRLSGRVALGAVASQPAKVSTAGASHSAPRTRDRSIIRTSIRTSPIENPSNIVPRVSSGRVREVTSSSPVSHVDPRHDGVAGALRFRLLSEHLVGPRVSSARERCSRSGVRRISWAQVQPRDLLSTLLWPGFYRMIVQPRFRAPVRSERMKSLFTAPVAAEARLLIPELEAGDLVRSYAGNRAQAV